MTDASKSMMEDPLPVDRIQLNREVPTRSVIIIGLGMTAGIGVLSILGRFVFSYDARGSAIGYLLLLLFITPFMLTHTERVASLGGERGLYGLVRGRYGLTLVFLAGWLELAGYVSVIAIFARLASMYGLTAYQTFVHEVAVNPKWISLGALVLIFLLELSGIRGSRKINATLTLLGFGLIIGLAIFSQINQPAELTRFPLVLKSIAPFKLSALFMASFWGLILVFHAPFPRHQGSHFYRTSWTIMVLMAALGAFLAISIIPGAAQGSASPNVLSVNNLSAVVFSGAPFYTMLIGLFAVLIALIGLERAFRAGATVADSMAADGFLPDVFQKRVHGVIVIPQLLAIPLAAGWLFFVESTAMLGLASVFFLAISILMYAPDIIRHRPRLPERCPIQLPYHPLFPALTVVIATLAVVNLPPQALIWGSAWLAAGVALLGTYAHRRALAVRAKQETFGDEKADYQKVQPAVAALPQGPIILALFRSPASLEPLLHLSARMARQQQAALALMQIVEVDEDLSESEREQAGVAAWKALITALDRIPQLPSDVAIQSMVRVASDPISGVINAAEELQPQLMLVAPDFIAEDPSRNLEEYDDILRKAGTHTLFLKHFPEVRALRRIAVLVERGVHAPISLSMAQALLDDEGVVQIVRVAPPDATEEDLARDRERLVSALHALGFEDDAMTITVLPASTLEDAVAKLARQTDLIIFGASANFMTRRSTFDGVNAHLFQHASVPTILVGRYQKPRLPWLSELWVTLTRTLPTLTLEERQEAAQAIMAGADPSVDFFILIFLSAGIATYGLLQNSGAVIIGAMLVAPLMSPIVAIAMSMVRGDVRRLGVAAQSTAQGVLLAIAVGAVLTFFSPIKSPTNEIMGRVTPNLLDLSIAFLSGAAGAYAMSRKSIASALPGVSIAVALVPPLAVVGYGFAVADMDIAFGALLLFLTNLVAIVLAASLVFIALDFLSTEKQTWNEIVRGLKVTVAFAMVVVLILGYVTYETVTTQKKLRAINTVLSQQLYTKRFKPLDISIQSTRNGYLIKGAILAFDEHLTSDLVQQLDVELEEAVHGPVTLDIIAIPAEEGEFDLKTAVETTRVEEAVREAIRRLPVQELDLTATALPDEYVVTLSILTFQPNAISPERVRELETNLAQQFGRPVTIDVYAIPAENIQSESTPSGAIPTPAITPAAESAPSS